jgi:hypothetical protein
MQQTNAPTARALIIEDEILIALELEDLLAGLGYAVCGLAPNGSKALNLAVSHRPNLALVDVRLEASAPNSESFIRLFRGNLYANGSGAISCEAEVTRVHRIACKLSSPRISLKPEARLRKVRPGTLVSRSVSSYIAYHNDLPRASVLPRSRNCLSAQEGQASPPDLGGPGRRGK